ncbi:MAG: hypothetical protein NVSMB14_00710 [Isosphaeraceae bacterium]
MTRRTSFLAVLLLMVVLNVLFLSLTALGWGGWSGLLAHPARVGLVAASLLSTVGLLFSGANLDGFKRPKVHDRWILALFLPLALAMAWLPAYTDRRNLWSLDGDAVRYSGLAILIVGMVLRIGPMYLLGRRFTWPLATQEHHVLVTSGYYRYIRHPSYLGALLIMIGWILVFRSGISFLLVLLIIPFSLFVIPKEEALLSAEFGEEYENYRRRTWRMIPFVY